MKSLKEGQRERNKERDSTSEYDQRKKARQKKKDGNVRAKRRK